ncbi:MAG: metal ABC transporter solute-binding protein, Zn/Mn family [Bacteroidota bacterium]
MNKFPGFLFLITPVLFLIFSGCDSGENTHGNDRIITVSILPQKYFVDKVSGKRFDVNVMIPPGASPVTYEPSPKQMSNIGNSEAYLKIGYVVFERAWMDRIQSANPHLKIFDQSDNLDVINHGQDSSNAVTQSHGKGVDPHIWLSPEAVKIQLKNIRDMLIKLDSANREQYRENCQSLMTEIDSLDAQIRHSLEGIDSREFLIFHPALAYFARDYRLKQIPVQKEGKEPSPARIRNLVDKARERNIKVIMIQKQFSTDDAKALASELDGEVIQIDPLAYNWMENMKTIARKMKKALMDSER